MQTKLWLYIKQLTVDPTLKFCTKHTDPCVKNVSSGAVLKSTIQMNLYELIIIIMLIECSGVENLVHVFDK